VVESVTVDIVNLEVIVTDGKGKRVKGLTRNDFELQQDGRPQKITNFFAVDGGALVLEDGSAERSPAGAPPAAAAPDLAPPRTWIVVYIDNAFLAPANRTRAIRGVVDFLRSNLGASSQAMIMTADRTFKIRKRFTDRLGELVEVLDKVAEESTFASSRQSERLSIFQEIESSKSSDRVENLARNWARETRNDVDFSLGALKEALRTLSGLDGRKVLLHVSDGLPSQVGRELFDAIDKKYRGRTGFQNEFDRTMSYEAVVNQANSVGVTMYTLDASGLSTDGVGSAEISRPTGMADTMLLSRWNTQDTLKTFAEGTGGLAFINRNDLGQALEDVSADLGSYYSLGFPAPAGGADRLRKLEVRMKKKGLTARMRQGFSEKSSFQKVSEQVISSLFFPRNENPLAISIIRGKTIEAEAGAFFVPIEVRIPIGKLTLVPRAGEEEVARVTLFFAVLDTDGRQSDLTNVPQEIVVPSAEVEKAKGRYWSYSTKLLMLPGSQRLSLGVRDDISGLISLVTQDIFVSVFDVEKRGPKKSGTFNP
jgi:VWFA-related protein